MYYFNFYTLIIVYHHISIISDTIYNITYADF